MTHILTKAEVRKPMPIPDELHRHITRITGELVCSKCKAVIIEEGIEYDDYTSDSIRHLVAAHVCGIDLKRVKYDFNSQLTLKEQILAMEVGDSLITPAREKPRPRW